MKYLVITFALIALAITAYGHKRIVDEDVASVPVVCGSDDVRVLVKHLDLECRR